MPKFQTILGKALSHSFCAGSFPGKIFHKNAWISTYSPKTEFDKLFPTTGGVTFVQNSISYKKFPSEIFHNNASISTYRPKTEFERSFSTPGSDTFVSNSVSFDQWQWHVCSKANFLQKSS